MRQTQHMECKLGKQRIHHSAIWILLSLQALSKKEPVYQALWAANTDFDEVLISPVMIQDHMPDTVLEALNKVDKKPYHHPQGFRRTEMSAYELRPAPPDIR
ncbi:hypothetical protein HUJ04_000571 [Dendroctonus ponderosae]|nr:hypothetical protein HUJ04_000571 [Dendroctonus ponderosae]